MKFKVCIEETVSEEFEVEAKNKKDAVEVAIKKYKNCEIVLEPGNVMLRRVAVCEDNNNEPVWVEF